MLLIANKLSELSFSKLMDVYQESNRSNGLERYPKEVPDEQRYLAERDFYHYLNSVFFRQADSFYAIWEEKGAYKAALRLEPYEDGLLLCALETVPYERRKGYASLLIKALQDYLMQINVSNVYSHVSKRNEPSLSVHFNNGFILSKDYARYSDGSVLQNTNTLLLIIRKSEI